MHGAERYGQQVQDWLVARTAQSPTVLKSGRLTTAATGAGDQNLVTVSIPANSLSTNRCVRWTLLLRRTTGSGSGTFKVKYGSTTLITGTAFALTPFVLQGHLWGDGATNAQRANLFQMPIAIASSSFQGTAAEDSTGALNLAIDVDLATDGDVFTADYFEAVLMPAV